LPYITPQARDDLFAKRNADTSGELNFVITEEIADYILRKGLSYETLNAVIGVLECAKQELYRRVISTYEDQACAKNGEVYDGRLFPLP
jgi:hypothetical protein